MFGLKRQKLLWGYSHDDFPEEAAFGVVGGGMARSKWAIFVDWRAILALQIGRLIFGRPIRAWPVTPALSVSTVRQLLSWLNQVLEVSRYALFAGVRICEAIWRVVLVHLQIQILLAVGVRVEQVLADG